MKKGTLKPNGVHLQDHEYVTVKLLLENGFDVELIPPSQIKHNVIIDLRRCKMSEEKAINDFKKEFSVSKHFRQMKIITKSAEILDFSK